MLRVTDRLIGKPRGSVDAALLYAARWYFPNADPDIVDYVREVYAVAPLVEIDPALVIAQSVHETTNVQTGRPWNSKWWRERLNPAGLGITGDPKEDNRSRTWALPEGAAHSHVGHLLIYALGPSDAGSLWARKIGGAPLSEIDPRYGAYLEAFGNVARAATLSDLAGRWAVDTDYATKIAAVGNRVFPGIPDQEQTMPTPETIGYSSLPFPVHVSLIPESQPNQNPGISLTPTWVTIHETGSPNPATDTAKNEASWVRRGADGKQLSVHFFVDAHEAWQIMPLNRVAWHAADGNGPGNMTSLAIETVIEPTTLPQTRANVRALAALLIRSLPSLTPKGVAAVVQHNHWSGKDCPLICRHTQGCWEAQIEEIGDLLDDELPIWPENRIPAPDTISAQGHTLIPNKPVRFRALTGATLRTAPSRDAPAGTRAPAKRGRTYTFAYRAEVDGETWLVSRAGSWAPASAFEAA